MANEYKIPACLNYDEYNNYPSSENPTTNADFMYYSENQNILMKALVVSILWQPNTNYVVDKVVSSPNMPDGMEAVALSGGVTGQNEPAWTINNSIYKDGGVTWKLQYKDCAKNGKIYGSIRERIGKPSYGL